MRPSVDRDEDRVVGLVPADDRFTSLKTALRRKRQRPASLTPLDSPQHTHRNLDDGSTGNIREAQQSSPQRPGPSACVSPLPPLVSTLLERKRLFLNPHGESVIGIEEILQLQERQTPLKLRASPLQLIAVPHKVFDDDEVALMPCHSLHYRHVPSLAVEKWKEPVRDRGKNWRDDELTMILATRGSGSAGKNALAETKMTRGPGNVRKGTWRKLDSQRLQLKPSGSTGVEASIMSPRDVSQPGEVLLRVQGAMVSRTYCVVTIYGVGIYGRLYSEGLADREGQLRFLRIDAYDPSASRTTSLRVSLADLAWVFEAHPDLLAAGRKQTVLRKVVSLLYFQYPDEALEAENETPRVVSTIPPVLCISPDEKLNEAARRRRERDERLRREEAERLRLLALLNQLPRRARHRIVIQLRRVSGHDFVISIYQFPSQVRTFLVTAYHTRTSRTLTLGVSVQEAATLSRVFSQPHKWTREQTAAIAQALVPRLYLRASKAKVFAGESPGDEQELYRVALAIQDDRAGVPCAWLALPLAPNAATRKHEIITKYQTDGQHELRLSLEQQLATLERDTTTKADQLRGEMAQAEATLVALQHKDAALKESIDEINSGKGIMVDETHKQHHHHEQRRGQKAARKTIKDESKALHVRVAAWKRELELTREHAMVEKEKAQIQYDKAVDALQQKAVTATLPLWFDPLEDRTAPLMPSQEGGNRQRTRLHRAEIRDDGLRLAGGACLVSGHRYRFSVFAEVPPAPVEKEELDSEVTVIEWFRLSFYDARTSGSLSLRLLWLEWLALTKSQHDAQLLIPALGVATSLVVQQVAALEEQYEATRHSLNALKPLRKNEKKRKQLISELCKNRVEKRKLWSDHTPWGQVVRALCDRLQVTETQELILDRCLYRSTMGIVSLESERDGGGDDDVVDCEVWATQSLLSVAFHARDLLTQDEWALDYPDSVELVKEFAVETQLELTLHLEAIAMTLLLYAEDNDETITSGEKKKHRKMRFEE